MQSSASDVLHEVFGYADFKPGQAEIINLLGSATNTLAVMPTGAGKSLCYQIPAILADRPTIVISPLVALMDDQVAGLRANGVDAACIHSGQTREENVANWRRVASGLAKLLYLSPERLMTQRMLEAIGALNPALFVIDEAHCISKWGSSFRPDYEQLSQLKTHFPNAAIGAFTATADKATRDDVAAKLFRGQGEIIVHGFDRPNLTLAVATKSDWKGQLASFLEGREGREGQSGIIYCLSRKFTEEVAAHLSDNGTDAIAYHAGQDASRRRANQDRFMSETGVVMVATIAFGMGIDKPDIRFVCHLNLPSSMEAYYQEIGRAGRDGAPADTMMLYGLDDMRMRRQFIEQDGEDQDHKLREHKRLDSLLAYCEASQCRRATLLAYFDETIEPCGNCDNCLNPPVVVDGTPQAQMLFDAIERTGEFFGAVHIIDVLRGADTAKIKERGHETLPCYGAGKDRTKIYWQAFIRQALAGRALSINIQKYGCLEITPMGRAIARGEEPFLYREIREREKTKRSKSSRKAHAAIAPENEDLLAKLKALRLSLSKERGVPAYVIFGDASLIEMATKQPTTLAEMSEINGVGPRKLESFGEMFLDLTKTRELEPHV